MSEESKVSMSFGRPQGPERGMRPETFWVRAPRPKSGLARGRVLRAIREMGRPASIDEIGGYLGLPKQLRFFIITGMLRSLRRDGYIENVPQKSGQFFGLTDKGSQGWP